MKKISIIGLGYVGSAMAIVLADAKNKKKNLFDVTGLDTNTTFGLDRINKLNNYKFPFKTNDKQIYQKLNSIKKSKNLKAKIFNSKTIQESSIILISTNFDFSKNKMKMLENIKVYANDFREIIKNVKKKTLIVMESTLPPGFIENIILPIFKTELKKRKIDFKSVYLGYSYERVTPGRNYLNSIINGYRVYSGINKASKRECKNFLKKIINFTKYPLTELENITATEIAKTMENSFRAVNIAFIEEWTILCEKLNINLKKIVDTIKQRPTHKNMMYPGFGVGGYCLTKDPLLPDSSAKLIIKNKNLKFQFSKLAIKTNNSMPLRLFEIIKLNLKNKLSNKKILLCGAAYKEEVDDTRNSPSLVLYKKLINKKASIDVYDPLVDYWNEAKIEVLKKIPNLKLYDVIIFATKHENYKKISFKKKFSKQVFFDLNNVLINKQIIDARKNKINLFIVGKGLV